MGSGLQHVIREAFVWLAAACAVAAGIYYVNAIGLTFDEAENAARAALEANPVEEGAPRAAAERSVRLRADRNGHFAVKAYVNGRAVDFMADTGATVVALTYEDAQRLGFSGGALHFTGLTKTANGLARVAPVTIDRLEVDDIMVRNVPAMVAEPGKLAVNLLGMSFISRLSRFDMQGNELVLVQ